MFFTRVVSIFNRPELVLDTHGFTSEVNALAFSPYGRLLAAAGGKEVRLWDVETGALRQTLRGERSRAGLGNCNAVAFSPDGKELVVGIDDYSEAGSLRVYDTGNFREIQEVVAGHAAPVRMLAFSRDGRYLGSAGENGKILLWDWKARRRLTTIEPPRPDQPLYSFLDFPTADPVLMAGVGEGPALFSVPGGKKLGPRDQIPAPLLDWLVNGSKLQFPGKGAPDASTFLLDRGYWLAGGNAVRSGAREYWVGVWKGAAPSPSVVYRGHRWLIRAVTADVAGTWAASADKYGAIHVWNLSTGEVRHVFQGVGQSLYDVEVAAGKGTSGKGIEGADLRFGTVPHGGAAWTFNSFGNLNRVFQLKTRAIGEMAPVPRLKREVTGPLRLQVESDKSTYYVGVTRDGRRQLRHRLATGTIPMCFEFLNGPHFGSRNPVLVGTDAGALFSFDPASDTYGRWFVGHGSSVTGFQESEDGGLLVSASTDRTIRFWSLGDHRPNADFGFRYLSNIVMEVQPGTSAEKQGIKSGDRILTIDGLSLNDFDELRILGRRRRRRKPRPAGPKCDRK